MSARVVRSCGAVLLAAGLVVVVAAQDDVPATVPATQPMSVQAGRPAASAPAQPTPRVVLEIGRGDEDWGKIVVELYPMKAPLTVRNFLGYVDQGYYNGTIFHRIIADFMIQGGGYTSLTDKKLAGVHEPVRSEARNGLKNVKYSLAMARNPRDPQSATTQFFINLADNPALDFSGNNGGGYCVFGQVVEGMEVVDRIAGVPTRPNPQLTIEKSQPVDPPMIKLVRREVVEPSSRPAMPPSPQPSTPVPGAAGGAPATQPQMPPPSPPPAPPGGGAPK